ncbi:MAG: TRAP transporter substrate-binding protein [Thermodesulfobacteriota bacterium]
MEKRESFIVAILISLLIVVGTGKRAMGAPIELKIANFQPTMHKSNEMIQDWAQLIEKETGGKVKFVLFPNATLAKANDTYDATVAGIADICWAFSAYNTGKFPLSEVTNLPLGFRNAEHLNQVLYDLYEEFPEVRAEYKDAHVLFITTSANMQIHSKKPVRSVNDLKGLKLRVPASEAYLIKALGGIPVTMAGPEVYQALERGTLDADLHPWETPISYRWYEVIRYHTQTDLYISGVFIFAMNQSTWKMLPDDVKKVIDKYSGKYGSIEFGAKGLWDKYNAYYLDWLKKNTPNEIIVWSEEEKAKARGLMRPALDQWKNAVEKKGLPGKKILDECIRLLKKYE